MHKIISIIIAIFVLNGIDVMGAEYKPSKITKLVMLGTGNPQPDPERSGPSLAIIVNSKPYIVDAGPGIVRRAASMTPRFGGNIPELIDHNLEHVFITHLHSDHTLGLDELLVQGWTSGRNVPLKVHGPEGIEELVEHLLKAYRIDRSVRIYGSQPSNNTGWRAEVFSFTSGGEIYKDKNVTVEAIPVKHGSWPLAVAYKFTTPDRTILISGDTAYSENVIEAAKGVDILVHEVIGIENFGEKVPLLMENTDYWKAYFGEFHTFTNELAKIANIAKPGLLVLYHEGVWSRDKNQNVKEINKLYKGKVVSANDLDVF